MRSGDGTGREGSRRRVAADADRSARCRVFPSRLFVILAAIAPVGLHGQDADPPEKNRPLISLIERFLENPFDEHLRTALIDSANARTDILVELSNAVNPWNCYGDTAADIRALDESLTTAYVGANMAVQLRDGRRRDRPREGVLGVLRAYSEIKLRMEAYRVPEVDRWREIDGAGKIEALADSLKHSRVTDCPEDPPKRYRGKVTIRSSRNKY